MRFIQDPNKQALEVIFSRKLKKESHPSFNFNSNIVYQATSQKYFGIILGNPLHFEEHLKESKISRILGLLREFHWLISRFRLLTIYKTFAKPHLGYGDIMYEKTYNSPFHKEYNLPDIMDF